MSKRQNSLIALCLNLPWWVNLLLSCTAYVSLVYVAPNINVSNPILQNMLRALPHVAPIFATLFVFTAALSFIRQRQQLKLLQAQTELDSIRSLSWQRFESLIAAYYRIQGFVVIEQLKPGADGGVDLRLSKGRKLHLVQCKQWRSQKVGIQIVREMYGVQTAEQASSMTIVTTGSYTKDAQEFADSVGVTLIDGEALWPMIRHAQANVQANETEPPPKPEQILSTTRDAKRICPKCNSTLVKRTAKRGANAGNEFFGCSAFPHCRYTEPTNK
ncbi:restriction endonuclease [Neiella sp. HB171785]|uniref:Restriction endonuclease n=1 Tax=Neiella litorisoli TaxID=2771431 RepID=A0A8J6ULN0_9GAMM|nr:restriction endonuclease [Neiella litorisoli]MBD1389265.1 restriction endonuclease [Neiella litorisoli]